MKKLNNKLALILTTVLMLSSANAETDEKGSFKRIRNAIKLIESQNPSTGEAEVTGEIAERRLRRPTLYPFGMKSGAACPRIKTNLEDDSGEPLLSTQHEFIYNDDCSRVYVAPAKRITLTKEVNTNIKNYKFCEPYQLASNAVSKTNETISKYKELIRKYNTQIANDDSAEESRVLKLEKKVARIEAMLAKEETALTSDKSKLKEFHKKKGIGISFYLDQTVSERALALLQKRNVILDRHNLENGVPKTIFAPVFEPLPVTSTLVYDYSSFSTHDSSTDGDTASDQTIFKATFGGLPLKINKDTKQVTKEVGNGGLGGQIILTQSGTCDFLKDNELLAAPVINVFHKAAVYPNQMFRAHLNITEMSNKLQDYESSTSGANQSSTTTENTKIHGIDLEQFFSFEFYSESKKSYESLKFNSDHCKSNQELANIDMETTEESVEEFGEKLKSNSGNACTLMGIMESTRDAMILTYLKSLENMGKIEFLTELQVKEAKAEKKVIHISKRLCRSKKALGIRYSKKCRNKMIPVTTYDPVKNKGTLGEFLKVEVNTIHEFKIHESESALFTSAYMLEKNEGSK